MNTELSQSLLPMVERVGWGIVQSCWLGAICAILLALTLRFARSAAARHLACMLALVATLVSTVVMAAQMSISSTQRRSATAKHGFVSLAGLPSQTVPGKETNRGQPSSCSEENMALDQRITNRRSMNPVSGFPAAAPSRSAAIVLFLRSPHFIAPVLPWLTMSWLMGVVFLSLRHFAGWRRIRAWRCGGCQIAHAPSQRLALEIGRKLHLRLVVPIVESAEVLTPVVVGTMRPIVLLPLRLISGFRPLELEAILAHELAHIARGDTWANLLQMVCETALFYHPAVWWMSRRARIERENAADDLATAVCADRLQYATALARLAEEAASPRLVLAANDGVLLARIRRLLVPNSQESNSGWATSGLMLGALVCAAFLVIDNSSKAGVDESAPVKPVADQSIQSVIDAAPAGAVSQLTEEERNERIVISKPLTLERAGGERALPEDGALASSGRQTSETGEKGFREVTMALGQGPQFLQSRIGTQNLSFDWFTDGDARQSGSNAFTGADLLETRWLKRSGQFLVAQGEGVLSRTTADPSQPPEAARKPAVDAKSWLEDAFQLDDKAKREAAIERIRQAMTSANAEEARAGVTAFVQLAAIEFDKASFRSAVRSLLSSTDAPTRAAAASAFTMTGADAADLERILALADDSAAEVRDRLTGIIVALTKGDLTGKPASDAILKLMNNLPRDSRNVAHAMWGVKFSQEIEARVLAFCRDIPAAGNGIIGYNFFYGALSTQANKSEASCRRLIELLAHQDTTNIAGRSAWGLQQGVAREQFPLVADAMVKVIEARTDGYLRNNALRCLRTYGDARQVPALKAFLAKPGVSGEFRKQLDETVGSLERRVVETAEQPAGAAPTTPPAVAQAGQGATPSSPPAAAASAPEKPELEVEWRGRWWPARVLRKEGETTLIHYVGFGSEWDETVPADRVRPIQVQNTQQSASVAPDAALVEQNRRAARLRAAEDRRNYSPEQLQEIESLYQVANTKGKRTPEAKASLKQLLEKYDKANRTGCATLYLGQASEGAERLEYLTRAVEKFSDCYYFNGCQVGGYGRYVLALTLWEKGEKEKALSLLTELKTKYKDATDHSGRPMGQVAEAVEKELAKPK